MPATSIDWCFKTATTSAKWSHRWLDDMKLKLTPDERHAAITRLDKTFGMNKHLAMKKIETLPIEAVTDIALYDKEAANYLKRQKSIYHPYRNSADVVQLERSAIQSRIRLVGNCNPVQMQRHAARYTSSFADVFSRRWTKRNLPPQCWHNADLIVGENSLEFLLTTAGNEIYRMLFVESDGRGMAKLALLRDTDYTLTLSTIRVIQNTLDLLEAFEAFIETAPRPGWNEKEVAGEKDKRLWKMLGPKGKGPFKAQAAANLRLKVEVRTRLKERGVRMGLLANATRMPHESEADFGIHLNKDLRLILSAATAEVQFRPTSSSECYSRVLKMMLTSEKINAFIDPDDPTNQPQYGYVDADGSDPHVFSLIKTARHLQAVTFLIVLEILIDLWNFELHNRIRATDLSMSFNEACRKSLPDQAAPDSIHDSGIHGSSGGAAAPGSIHDSSGGAAAPGSSYTGEARPPVSVPEGHEEGLTQRERNAEALEKLWETW